MKAMRLQLLSRTLQNDCLVLLAGAHDIVMLDIIDCLPEVDSRLEYPLMESFKAHQGSAMERQLQVLLGALGKNTELIQQQTKVLEMHEQQEAERHRRITEMLKQLYLSQRRHEGITLLSIREQFRPTSSDTEET